jgi:hypothetical protein
LISSLFGADEEESKSITPPATTPSSPAPSRTRSTSSTQAKPYKREEKFSPRSQGAHRDTKKSTPKATTPKEEGSTPSQPSHEFKGGRTRRGSRGGRRRSNPSTTTAAHHTENSSNIQQHPAQPVEKSTAPGTSRPTPSKTSEFKEPLPNHLPPFPADLEDYYRDAQPFKSTHKAQQQRSTPKAENVPAQPVTSPEASAFASTPTEKSVPAGEPIVPIVAKPEKTAEPVIIRAQPSSKEPNTSELDKEHPRVISEPSSQKTESAEKPTENKGKTEDSK